MKAENYIVMEQEKSAKQAIEEKQRKSFSESQAGVYEEWLERQKVKK